MRSVSAEWVRAGAAAAGRKAPTLYAYVRLALGAKGCEKLAEEGGRYAAIPAYGAHFDRMGVKPVDTCIAAQNPADVTTALGKWRARWTRSCCAPSPARTPPRRTSSYSAPPNPPEIEKPHTRNRAGGVGGGGRAAGGVGPSRVCAARRAAIHAA